MQRYQRERKRRGLGCLAWLVALIWFILLAGLVYRFVFQQQVSQLIGSRIGEQLRDGQPQVQPSPTLDAEAVLPTVIAALPPVEVRISEVQANEALATLVDSTQPLQSITVHFVPDSVQMEVKALDITSTLRTGLAVQNGHIIAVAPEIDGVLGQLISATDLTSALERQLNDRINTQGVRLKDVQITQGELIVTVGGS